MLDLALGLYADSLFGLIAVINSYIGIRQELKAKSTLDELAVLVAPHAKVVRDGKVVELLATEVVPGDVVAVDPGDQLVADGEVIASRGLSVDESMLSGESDGVPKDAGERVLSGSFCISGSGHYLADAVREESYAGRLAGEAKTFRHPPSPLQEEVNRVIVACVYVMVPLAAILLFTLKVRNISIEEAAQTATAGLVTLIPEGMVLLMSVTFAVAAVRLARKNTLIQQMSATESLAAVDTICIDKTGTLTDGELRLVSVAPAPGVSESKAHAALGRFAASAGDRKRDPGDDRGALRRSLGGAWGRGSLLLGVEVERGRDRRDQPTCWGPPTCSARPGRSACRRSWRKRLRKRPRRDGGSSPSANPRQPLPADPSAAGTTAAHPDCAGRA